MFDLGQQGEIAVATEVGPPAARGGADLRHQHLEGLDPVLRPREPHEGGARRGDLPAACRGLDASRARSSLRALAHPRHAHLPAPRPGPERGPDRGLSLASVPNPKSVTKFGGVSTTLAALLLLAIAPTIPRRRALPAPPIRPRLWQRTSGPGH